MKNIVILLTTIIFLLSGCADDQLTRINELKDKISINRTNQYKRSADLMGTKLFSDYDSLLKTIEKDNLKNIVSNLESFEKLLSVQLGFYSEVWRDAIDEYVQNHIRPDFHDALDIVKQEYSNIGIFSKIDSLKDKLQERVSKLDKQKYQKTYELYAIVFQMVSFCKELKGSLMTFNSTINNLDNEFSKTLASAELEFK